MTYTPPLPAWAQTLEHARMVKGSDLKPSDILYFSPNAWPRTLWKKLDGKAWSCTTKKTFSDVKEKITVDAWRYYVVQRVPAPVLDYIRVAGHDLDVGDVVDFTAPGRPTRHVEIIEIAESEYRPFGQGNCRDAQCRAVGSSETFAHTFCNFSLLDFTVVGGPKLDAARQDTMLVKKAPVGYHWLGGRLKVTT